MGVGDTSDLYCHNRNGQRRYWPDRWFTLAPAAMLELLPIPESDTLLALNAVIIMAVLWHENRLLEPGLCLWADLCRLLVVIC